MWRGKRGASPRAGLIELAGATAGVAMSRI